MRRAVAIVCASCLLLAAAGGVSHARSKASRGKRNTGAPETYTAKPETVEMVEAFLKAKTKDLPSDYIPEFMAVDPGSLPKRLRDRYRAKREELRGLQRLSAAKSKAGLRRLGRKEDEASCDYEEGTEQYLAFIKKMGGFFEISSDEESFLIRKTKCSECELQEEFTLTIVLTPSKKKGGRKIRHLLLKGGDPLEPLVGAYRRGSDGTTGTKFFGVGMTPACR